MTNNIPFVLMAKPIGSACNMICDYCYYRNVSIRPQLMKLAALETFIKKYIDENPSPVIKFFWHGGEPTLAGIDFYHQVITFQNKYKPDGKMIFNNIQTNGLNLDDEWCAFLAKHKFDVGLSIDGDRFTHDYYRHDQNHNETYEKIITNLRRLQSYGIQPDLLCTVNAHNIKYPLEVYCALRDLHTGWLQFIPIIEVDDNKQFTKESISAQDYGNFLCAIFDEWLLNDFDNTQIQMFADMELVANGKGSTVCQTSKHCGNVLVVENNGDIYACDHYLSSDYYLGNIMNDSLQDMLNSPSQENFKQAKSDLPSACKQCRWLRYCYGGCPKNRYLNDNDDNMYHLCEGLKTFYRHSDKPFKHYLALKKQGLASDEIKKSIKEYYKADR